MSNTLKGIRFVRAIALAAICALILTMFPLPQSKAEVASEKTVWRVAWITIPEAHVWVGAQLVITKGKPEYQKTFDDAAIFFENYIEMNTNNAVDVEISHITIDETPENWSQSTDEISYYPRLTPEMKEKYDIESYDTWMVGWPYTNDPDSFEYNNKYHYANVVTAWTYDSREIYMYASLDTTSLGWTTVHEFLHTTEHWFRDTLHFPLPYIPPPYTNEGIMMDPKDDLNALHYRTYYGYIADVDNVFYADWLAQKVEDPQRPGTYLGIPAEAWQNTPSRISVIFEPNNGTEPVVNVVHTGAAVSKPANPSPTESTGDTIFRGWYLDKGCTQRAYFPYSVTGNVTFYAKWGDSNDGRYIVNSDNGEVYLDLGSEWLYGAAEWGMMAYSIDGGAKWTAGQPHLTNLLNKQMNLQLTDSFDTKTKKPTANANIITFPQIEKRPAANPDKLVINYAICADDTGATPGAWTLSKKNENIARVEGIEIAATQDKKNPRAQEDGTVWFAIGDEGVPVLPYGAAKETYLARTAPIAGDGRYVPASKTFKLSPAVQGKPTKIKADYKKEIIKLKTGLNIFGGTFEQLNSSVPVATTSSLFDTGLRYTAQTTDSRTGIPLTAILDRTDKGSNTTQTICIWTPATDKKPSTKVQEYKLAMRGIIEPQTLNGTNGRVTLPREFEVYDTTKSRWGTLPRFTESKTLENAVRLKTTARATGTDDSSQTAASIAVTLTVEYGVYTLPDARTAKSGILSVGIGDTALPEENEEVLAA